MDCYARTKSHLTQPSLCFLHDNLTQDNSNNSNIRPLLSGEGGVNDLSKVNKGSFSGIQYMDIIQR